VLILTIQEDPPSLDTYDEEEEAGGDDDDDLLDCCDEEFSKSFRSLVDSCLQKNPARRPKCTDLLQSRPLLAFQDPAYRETRRSAIVSEVCATVDDVGGPDGAGGSSGQPPDGSSYNYPHLPGSTPVSIVLSQEDIGSNRQAGTTWVFADGSQVLSSSAAAAGSSSTVEDVLDEMDQFGMRTGGEHYNRGGQQQVQQGGQQPPHQPLSSPPEEARTETTASNSSKGGPEDDLDAFMDEFEMNTQGENFRHPSN
jgi:serine/threonine protein kinase